MNNSRRRNFRSRPQKNNFRRRNGQVQQLAKDAQSNGDPILAQNYLQHADHYLRRFNELVEKKDSFAERQKISNQSVSQDEKKETEKKLSTTTN